MLSFEAKKVLMEKRTPGDAGVGTYVEGGDVGEPHQSSLASSAVAGDAVMDERGVGRAP